ncbi:ROK family protein [Belnapia sp. T6]|uniref:ROK family protein n=1 Tax=Belnapia mucosa TaxID=2804532 RepID=A0ABS1V8J4_9PROT|nr:ROK family protein [Belnapia mucosa]MBL6457947.1 ROK family protein [Belnapia mucosa]
MTEQARRPNPPGFPAHGATELPAVTVDTANATLRTPEGFLGDKASSTAFRAILAEWRKRLKAVDKEDPFGDAAPETIPRRQLDKLLAEGDPELAGLVHGVVEEFAQSFATVCKRLLKLKEWQDTERIVIGGGLRGSRVGELAIGRAAMLLKGEEITVELVPIRHDPDEAGMIGATQLAPPWIFLGHDALLAVDIGGSNIRVGLVRPHLKKAPDLSEACIWESEIWRHREDKPDREAAIDRLVAMLQAMLHKAEKRGLAVAPFIGIGCPGHIEPDGSIAHGAQNLPGNWESDRFNLPAKLHAALPEIGGHGTVVVMHNDAVVQGLSEVPWMGDVKHWGVLTIGTGLGNARFTNRKG